MLLAAVVALVAGVVPAGGNRRAEAQLPTLPVGVGSTGGVVEWSADVDPAPHTILAGPGGLALWAASNDAVSRIVAGVVTGTIGAAALGGDIEAIALATDGSTVFVAAGNGALAAYDTHTLLERGRRTLTDERCADSLAAAGGRIWFTQGPCWSWVRNEVASIDPALGTDQVVADAGWIGEVALRRAGDDAVVVAGMHVDGGSVVGRYAVDGSTATLGPTSPYEPPWADVSNLVVPDDGSRVVFGALRYDGETLEPLAPFDAGSVSSASADGRHYAGTEPWSYRSEAEQVVLWEDGIATPVLGGGPPWGAEPITATAISDDGRVVWASDRGGRISQVRFAPAPARLSLDAEAATPSTGPIVTGRLEVPGSLPAAGQVVLVERTGTGRPVLVGPAVTGLDGRFELVDALAPPGAHTYRARWVGDLDHPDGAFALAPLTVGPPVPMPAPAPDVLGDLVVPIDGPAPHTILVDEHRERVVLLTGATASNVTDVSGTVTVRDFRGALVGFVAVPTRATDAELTPDGSHLLLALPDSRVVLVVDATTLLVVGAWRPGPAATMPWDLVLTDQRVIVDGQTTAYQEIVSADLHEPWRLRDEVQFDAFYDHLVPDRLRGSSVFQVGSFAMRRWDLSQQPPVVSGEHAVRAQVDPEVIVSSDGTALLWPANYGITHVDTTTFAEGQHRLDDFGSTRPHLRASGPVGASVIVAGSDSYDVLVRSIGPTGEVRRDWSFTDDGVSAIATTRTGSHAFLTTTDDRNPMRIDPDERPTGPHRMRLRIIQDPFARAAPVPPPTTTTTTTPPTATTSAPSTTVPPTTTPTTTVPATAGLDLGSWSSIGGVVRSSPAVASATPYSAAIAVRGQDDGVYGTVIGVGATPFRHLGGATREGPAVVARTSGVEVFVNGLDGALWSTTCTSVFGCGAWTSLGGRLLGSPAAAALPGGRTVVLVRGMDSQLWQRLRTGSTWGPWTALGGGLAAGPAVTATGGDALVVAVTGGDGAAWVRSHGPSGWGPWARTSGRTTAQPALLAAPGGAVHLVLRGLDGAAWASSRPAGGTFGAVRRLGGGLVGGPAGAPVAVDGGSLGVVVVRGLDDAVWWANTTFR